MTNGVSQLGTIECVEMEFVDTVMAQSGYLLDGYVRCDQATGLRIIIETGESLGKPVGDLRSAARGKPRHLGKTRDRQNTGDDTDVDASSNTAITEAQVIVRVEEKLGDGARGTGIDFLA